jgi:hypothetical protein
MSALALVTDPSTFGWPPGLPFELALRQAKPSEVCQSYGLAKSDYVRLCNDPAFIEALEDACEQVKREGVTFRKKAQVQAEELLKTSWTLIHESFENVPAKVKADLIMWTQRIAGYDASLDQKALAQASAVQQNALQIIINLGDA